MSMTSEESMLLELLALHCIQNANASAGMSIELALKRVQDAQQNKVALEKPAPSFSDYYFEIRVWKHELEWDWSIWKVEATTGAAFKAVTNKYSTEPSRLNAFIRAGNALDEIIRLQKTFLKDDTNA